MSDDTTELDVKKARLEAIRQIAKSAAEVLRNLGIVAALIAGLWATCSKADKADTQQSYKLTRDAIETMGRVQQDQYETTEQIKTAVEGQGDAVKAIASSSPSSAIPVAAKPVDKGCWAGPGGIVRCRRVAEAASAPKAVVSVPEPLPPSPRPPPISLPEPKEAFE